MADNIITPIVPGRGLNTETSVKLRNDFLQEKGYSVKNIKDSSINLNDIRNNIESVIGSTEIPVGLIGPLLSKNDNEYLYCMAGTLEGALVASMNRGSKAISQSGGFSSEFIHQKMIRSPQFIFERLEQSVRFKKWIEKKFNEIQEISGQYSNHANLISIIPSIIGKSVHVKMVYTTEDASGQNMTTTCTWHAMLWIVEHFHKETNINVLHYVIEGNGASDKKVSHFSIFHGRGCHVITECFLNEETINKVLRTTATDILNFYNSSLAMSLIDGMIGYNINVANVIAAIFVATGQDLGSLHESSTGVLYIEKTMEGLYFSLTLPSLVIGTVGGGTNLPKQKEALELMGCHGNGKIERFARSIAGFALALEISTYSAIVSGEFAKAHERLGRNKPANWLLKSDIDTAFIQECIYDKSIKIETVSISKRGLIENGILTDITKRACKKLIGFIPVNIKYHKNNKKFDKQVLIKSKALDIEVIKGLHLMAASIDPQLSDLIYKYKDSLEYANSHLKELSIFKELHSNGFDSIPKYYGQKINTENETYLFIQEFLYYSELKLYNTEDNPEKWNSDLIKSVIVEISKIHNHFTVQKRNIPNEISSFYPWDAKPLYKKLISIAVSEAETPELREKYEKLHKFNNELKSDFEKLEIPKTLIHNDFNSRNLAVRNNNSVCIYDWELSIIGIPHRDIVEFLSFVFTEDFSKKDLKEYLSFHYSTFNTTLSKEKWYEGYRYALKEYLVTRVVFYEVSGVLLKYNFTNRILNNSFKMLDILTDSTF